MKIIKLNGLSFKLIPQINEGSCEGCYFNIDNLRLSDSCTVNLLDTPDEYCCGNIEAVYERVSLKENLSEL